MPCCSRGPGAFGNWPLEQCGCALPKQCLTTEGPPVAQSGCCCDAAPALRFPSSCGTKNANMSRGSYTKQKLKLLAYCRQMETCFLLLVPSSKKSSQHQKRSCLELKCAVFLRGRETSHRKYYKEGLNLSAVQTLLRPHALYSGNAVKPLSTQQAELGQASSGWQGWGGG